MDHHVEELQQAHLFVLDGGVAYEQADALATHGDVASHHVRIGIGTLYHLLQLLLGNVVYIHGCPVGAFHEVAQLLARSVHLGGGGDAWHHDLHLSGQVLADGEAVAILDGAGLYQRVVYDESLQLLELEEWLTVA